MSTNDFFNKSKIKFFQHTNSIQLQNDVNDFMARQKKIYNVRHLVGLWKNGCYMHFVMVSYE